MVSRKFGRPQIEIRGDKPAGAEALFMKWVILFVVLAAVAVWAHMSRYQSGLPLAENLIACVRHHCIILHCPLRCELHFFLLLFRRGKRFHQL